MNDVNHRLFAHRSQAVSAQGYYPHFACDSGKRQKRLKAGKNLLFPRPSAAVSDASGIERFMVFVLLSVMMIFLFRREQYDRAPCFD